MSDSYVFTGTAPALVTPFTENDEIDENAFRHLIERQIEGGVNGLVVLGTTGENPTISAEERRRITDLAVEAADGRVPVILGTGTNATQESVRFSKQAARAGADGLLVVGPYYNKPTQEGFYQHVATIAEAVPDCPIIVYNVPGRTSFNVEPETILRLAEEVPSMAGVKEASGDLEQITDLLAHRPEGLAVYSGDDEITLPLVALGGDGVVSVTANALPERFSEMVRAALADEIGEARRRHLALLPAMRACFFHTNPLPVKAALAATGQINGRVRLPLAPMDEAERRRVLNAFSAFLEV
jgi:4-hydroxy-tetrahydrodipicolinate synthase